MRFSELLKQPKNYYFIFIVEILERFSYYGMNSIVALYATNSLKLPSEQLQITLSIFITLLFLPVFMGGYAIDRYFSNKSALLISSSLLATGYLILAFSSISTFYWGLAFVLAGNVFFKVAPASLLAKTAIKNDKTLDSIFTLYYMAINAGSFLGMAIFPSIVKTYGFSIAFCFSSAGVMVTIFLCAANGYFISSKKPTISHTKILTVLILTCLFIVIVRFSLQSSSLANLFYVAIATLALAIFTKNLKISNLINKKRMLISIILMIEAMVYFIPNWYTPLTLKFFATHFSDNNIFGFEIKHSLFQTLNPFFIFVFSPILAYYYSYRNKSEKDASITTKFAIGILCCAIGFLLLPIGYYLKGNETLVSANWVSISYASLALGELLVGGLGLSMMARLAPPKSFNFMLGLWYITQAASIFIGQLLPEAPDSIKSHLTTDIALDFYAKQFLTLGLIVLFFSILMLIFSEKLSSIIDQPRTIKKHTNSTIHLTDSLSNKLSKKASNYLLIIGIIVALVILFANHSISTRMYNMQINNWINHFSNKADSYLTNKSTHELDDGIETLKASKLFSNFTIFDSKKSIIDQFGHNPELANGIYKLHPLLDKNNKIIGYYEYTTDYNHYFTPFLWLTVIYLLTLVFIYFILKKVLTTGFNNELSKFSNFLGQIESLTDRIKKTDLLPNSKPTHLLDASEEEIKINRLFTSLVSEISKSYSHIREITSEVEKEKANANLSRVALQVAHDIRSPLMALDMLVKRLPELNESKQRMLSDGLNHIRNITNNLEKTGNEKQNRETRSPTQVAVLIDYVLSERLTAFSKNTTDIRYNIQTSSYFLFANVISSEMRRVLSNILNNACEAAPLENGIVSINVTNNTRHIMIDIADNGAGISEEATKKIFTLGFTTKAHGSGLGLASAKETLAKWDGDIQLLKNVPTGTLARIIIPLEPPPPWFMSALSINENSTIVCVDDCNSIQQAWQHRFSMLDANIDLQYCESKKVLLEHLKSYQKTCTYLIDYEFSGQPYTGLELINFILAIPGNRAILVTSHFNDQEIQKFCQLRNALLLPKFLASNIPLRIIKRSQQKVIVSSNFNYHDLKKSTINSLDILFYQNISELKLDLPSLDKSCHFFIERTLEEEVKAILISYSFTVEIFDDFNPPCFERHLQ